ncbi:MAG: MOSC domain-containing protein, partial [Ignavibacteriales bacterium]|nr:MOSC domain-containing protein [Ignavibacteriales bacterium]
MNNQGTVTSLQVCPGHRKPMIYITALEAIEGKGLKGDMHALPESSRQVLLIEQETLNGLQLTPGLVKENITTAGIALMKLKFGQRIQIGQAIFQLTKPCEPCSRMEE